MAFGRKSAKLNLPPVQKRMIFGVASLPGNELSASSSNLADLDQSHLILGLVFHPSSAGTDAGVLGAQNCRHTKQHKARYERFYRKPRVSLQSVPHLNPAACLPVRKTLTQPK